jgi:teichuronic acid biosynthesis glycosyltransferase TuaG
MVDQEKTGPLQMMNIHHEDFALWLSLLKRGFIAYGLQQDLARYRVMKSSISGRKMKAAAWVWNIYRRVEKLSLPYAAWCFMNYSWNAYRKSRSCS